MQISCPWGAGTGSVHRQKQCDPRAACGRQWVAGIGLVKIFDTGLVRNFCRRTPCPCARQCRGRLTSCPSFRARTRHGPRPQSSSPKRWAARAARAGSARPSADSGLFARWNRGAPRRLRSGRIEWLGARAAPAGCCPAAAGLRHRPPDSAALRQGLVVPAGLSSNRAKACVSCLQCGRQPAGGQARAAKCCFLAWQAALFATSGLGGAQEKHPPLGADRLSKVKCAILSNSAASSLGEFLARSVPRLYLFYL